MDRYESNGPPSHVTILAPPLRQVDLHGLLQSRKHVCAGSGLEKRRGHDWMLRSDQG